MRISMAEKPKHPLTISMLPRVNAAYGELLTAKREEQWVHTPYEQELAILNLIKQGDIEGVEVSGLGQAFELHDEHLSEDRLRQRKYELIAAITLVSRWAMEGGADMESAYSLADAYIQVADTNTRQGEILELHHALRRDFAALVRQGQKRQLRSRPVLRCIEYIESHLHHPIILEDLAAHVRLNAAYLSALFRQEMGIHIMAYINGKRLEEAKRLLVETGLPIADIAGTLGFNTPSYFSRVFRKAAGLTPAQYRSRLFRSHAVGETRSAEQGRARRCGGAEAGGGDGPPDAVEAAQGPAQKERGDEEEDL
jgi:AraC-like DNA-binding protein